MDHFGFSFIKAKSIVMGISTRACQTFSIDLCTLITKTLHFYFYNSGGGGGRRGVLIEKYL